MSKDRSNSNVVFIANKVVVSFGEALVDLVKNDNGFQPFVGGAPANVAVAISKLGGESHFIGSVGTDLFGKMIVDELTHYKVDTTHLRQLSSFPTAAAYVSLDDNGERSFSFSRHDTADLRYPLNDLPVELFKAKKGIFHFGSNSLTSDYMAAMTLALISTAKANGWLVSFDVNLRPDLWPESLMDKDRIMMFLVMADYIKMSNDEMKELAIDPALFDEQQKSVFIVTSGAASIELYTQNSMIEHQPVQVTAVDTTGAGDAFFGAFLHAVTTQQLFHCDANGYQQAVKFAAACGAYSVQNMGAISSYPDHQQMPFLSV